MTSGTAVPLVTVAVILPLPTTALLFPNPLTTRITPPAAIDRRGDQQENVLVAVDCSAFTNDVQAIVNVLGDRQNFEIAGR